MVQRKGSTKRRPSESCGRSVDLKKREQSSTKNATGISKTAKKRPSSLKSSFRKGQHSPKRVGQPVTFNQSVKYDDGSQSDMSKSPVTPPPSHGNSIGRKAKLPQPSSPPDQDILGTSSTAQTSDSQILRPRSIKSMLANLTPTPKTSKKSPLFFPLGSLKTAIPATKTPALSGEVVPDAPTPEAKTPNREGTSEMATKYEPYSPPPTQDGGTPGLEVLEELAREPRAVTLEEASDALIALRNEVRAFSAGHFDYQMASQEKHDWPLADLQDRHPEFVANCTFIADGSQYGWRKLFTEGYCRPHLVNGLLAHYLIEYVFKHTCFGLNENELGDLEDSVLKKYIHYDGFVRTKQLALGVDSILHAKSVDARVSDTSTAVQALTTRILSTISPLVPTSTEAQASISTSLTQIVTHAQSLGISLRLTGSNGTIFRFNFPAKHSEYQLGGAQSCLNASWVDATAHHAPDIDRDELRVKIPCWPTIIATVPSGPDMLDFNHDPTLTDHAGHSFPTTAGGGAPEDDPDVFVTEVFMSPADVYCEWTPLAAAPLSHPLTLSLRQAIAQAKNEHDLSLGQPQPCPRTTSYILAAAAAAASAVAVTTCTPHGRRLLLATAQHLTRYTNGSYVGAGAMKQVIDNATAGVTITTSFLGRIGRISLPLALPLPTHGLHASINRLRHLSGIVKSGRRTMVRTRTRTTINRAVVGETRDPPMSGGGSSSSSSSSGSSRSNTNDQTTARIYDWFPFNTTSLTDSPTSSMG